MTSANMVTWLHISDLHIRADESDTWNRDIVLKALRDDLQEQKLKSDLQPDFVLVSGDIAFSGESAEYKLARFFFDKLLEITNLPKTRLFLVPGNHDINRGLVSSAAKATTKDIVSRTGKAEFRRAVEDILNTDVDRALVFKRLQTYGEFVNDYLAQYLVYSDRQYFYVHTFNLADIQIAVLGLNSAWLCGGDEDRNHLLLGDYQVRKAIELAQSANLRIALIHHPFDWLHDLDRSDTEALLVQECDFILHGHMHHSEIEELRAPDGHAMIIAAGAGYEGRQGTNAYNLVQLDLNSGTGKVLLRRYSDERGGFWSKDTLTYRNVKDGEFQFPLPDKLVIRSPEEPRIDISQWPKFEENVDSKKLIVIRLKFLEAQLRDIIEKTSPGSGTHHSVLVSRIRNKAHSLLQRDVGQLAELLQSACPSKIAWALLSNIEKDIDSLVEEFLDFQAGSMLYSDNKVKELCDWTDGLLTEIGVCTGEGWHGACVLAKNGTAGQNSHLVRISFPSEDIWSLPLAVQQYVSLLQIIQQSAILMSFVGPAEVKVLPFLVADMLATHLVGPAYAFAVIIPSLSSRSQPSVQRNTAAPFDLRFNYIVKSLENCGSIYAPEVKLLKLVWQERSESIEGTALEQDDLVRRCLGYMDKLYSQVVSFNYGAAVNHSNRKVTARRIVQGYVHATKDSFSQASLTDILNAAWYSRMLSENSNDLNSMAVFYQELFRKKVAEVK